MANYGYITIGSTRTRVSKRAAFLWMVSTWNALKAEDNEKRRLEALTRGDSRQAVNLLMHYRSNTLPRMLRTCAKLWNELSEAEEERAFDHLSEEELLDTDAGYFRALYVYTMWRCGDYDPEGADACHMLD